MQFASNTASADRKTPTPAQFKCLKKAFEGALNLSPDKRNPLLILENFSPRYLETRQIPGACRKLDPQEVTKTLGKWTGTGQKKKRLNSF